ncbi:IS91 family transposase (plasmid) [Arsenophonus nasoniae]|nr:IS91 family transposase [Arsenophonus nasoniae]WGM13505.1 IS91 family transposase [Arsenophonus nasoniae]WGM17635.1 IS91 family transposase [Arsenophonus nasoniae]
METTQLREIEIEVVTKMLACGTPMMGFREYCCENENCDHQKLVCFTCKGRGCPSCGKKLTDNWIKTTIKRLPNVKWQHGTFTMPHSLWPLFELNRWLLGKLFPFAADNLLYAAKKRGLTMGIFGALHTYGRKLNWNTHIHLSWTMGGINQNEKWKSMQFDLAKVRKRWMWNVRQYLLSVWGKIYLPESLQHIRDYDEWKRFILNAGKNAEGKDYWHVYFADPTSNAKKTAKYLGRYLKKPPVSGARLEHYDGGSRITLRFFDHNTGHYKNLDLSQKELILRLIKQIPEKHFRMLRYFGFLANRVVGKFLDVVRNAVGQSEFKRKGSVPFALLSQRFLGVDPFSCILCGGRMRFSRFIKGLKISQLVYHALEIARMRYVPLLG